MGVKNLSAYLHKNAPHVYRAAPSLSAYAGLRFVVDVSIYMHKFAHAVGGDDFVQCIVTQARNLRAQNIGVTYVFDGSGAWATKAPELQKRRTARAKLAASTAAAMDALTSGAAGAEDAAQLSQEQKTREDQKTRDEHEQQKREELEKLQKRMVVVKSEHYARLMQLLHAEGVPHVVAEGEAEKACAHMVLSGAADVVVTDDIDALVCGAPRMLRNLGLATPHHNSAQEIRLDEVLALLKLTHPQFVDYCILCGCDFSGTLPGIGPVKALQLLREHGGTIEGVLRRVQPPPDVLQSFTFQDARRTFLDGMPLPRSNA
jgi:flap endonuclease-1